MSAIQSQILNTLQVIQKDISLLRTDVAGLKTDVAGLKTDVAGLKTDVAGLKTDVASLVDWRRKLSTIAEENTNSFFEREFRNKFPSSQIVRSYIKNFYVHNNSNPITEFDGCFLINPDQKIQRKTLTRQMAQLRTTTTLRNNTPICSPEFAYTVIIENKLTLDKRHIDKKVMLFQQIVDTIKSIKLNNSLNLKGNPQFKSMVDTFNIKCFPEKIVFIFACENVSQSLQQYISKINNNEFQTEEDYKLSTFTILQSDPTYNEFIEACSRYNTTPKPSDLSTDTFFKDLKKDRYIKSYDKLKEVIEYIDTNNTELDPNSILGNFEPFKKVLITLHKCIPYLNSCMTNFSSIHPEFQKIQGCIGFIKDKVIVTPLFTNKL